MQSKISMYYKLPSRMGSFHGRGRMNIKQHSSLMGFSKKRVLIFSLLFVTTALLLLISTTLQPGPLPPPLLHHHSHLMPQRLAVAAPAEEYPKWYDVVLRQTGRKRLRVGLVNTELRGQNQLPEELADLVRVEFDRVKPGIEWAHLFPEWIDERKPKCPEVPMPDFGRYRGLDVVVAAVPCGGGNATEGVRDVFRVQVSLLVANLVVESRAGGPAQPVYVVFLGGCEPMWEIFRCDDLIWKKGESMVYRPNVAKLKHKVLMPVGTCDLARPWNILDQPGTPSETKAKEAYVTMLHSSEHYVCGAIALAQSILETNTSKELVLLADDTISPRSIRGLSDAGWRVKRIERIKSPNAKPNAYNEWNYSKLRVWQATEYDKVMFIDADFILLKSLDRFFSYPQLSAAANNHDIFNSGIMIVEPSQCFFDKMMLKRHEIHSYNGGDQGFLNEVFTWWHMLTIKLNYLKIYMNPGDSRKVPGDRLTIHFLGMKPWVCYKDYDCNWDISSRHVFASDAAHKRWWKVYEAMPRRLQPFCAMTEKMNTKIMKWRENAKKDKYPNAHWKIVVKDPRQHRLTRP